MPLAFIKRCFTSKSSSQWMHVLTDSVSSTDLFQAVHQNLRLRKGHLQAVLPYDNVVAFMERYKALDSSSAKLSFLYNLSNNLSLDTEALDKACKSWLEPKEFNIESQLRAARRLHQLSEPLFSRLWNPISQQQDGIRLVVNMRADALVLERADPQKSKHLRTLSDNMRDVISQWFSVGVLQLHSITEETNTTFLSKIVEGEAVHPFSSEEDVKRRMCKEDRRVYAFSHPAYEGEPLIVLHVALTCENILPDSMSTLLHTAAPLNLEKNKVKTAVFYSISNLQLGLSGIDTGNFLIKAAAQKLMAEFPNLQTLVTLSPIPGFAPWLEQQRNNKMLLTTREAAALTQCYAGDAYEGNDPAHANSLLFWALQENKWTKLPSLEAALKPILLRLSTHYLVHEKRRFLALDPVANFHLRNGAELHRLCWAADTSDLGLRRSHGLMANYKYNLDEVALNNRKYLETGCVCIGVEIQHYISLLQQQQQQQQQQQHPQ